MEKGDYLWHPNQHKGFEWWISLEEAGGPLGSVHIAPQTWNDGVKIRPYIKFPQLEDVPAESGTSSSTTTSSSPARSASWATT